MALNTLYILCVNKVFTNTHEIICSSDSLAEVYARYSLMSPTYTAALIAIPTEGPPKFEAFYGNPLFREGMLKIAFEYYLQETRNMCEPVSTVIETTTVTSTVFPGSTTGTVFPGPTTTVFSGSTTATVFPGPTTTVFPGSTTATVFPGPTTTVFSGSTTGTSYPPTTTFSYTDNLNST